MKISLIPHNVESKQELFGLIGEICTDIEVHKALGAPIVSAHGDHWLVATHGNVVKGICGMRTLKSKASIKLHGLYTFDDPKLATQLRWVAGNEAKEMQVAELTITDLAELQAGYLAEGWKVVGPRGKNYLAYAKDLANNKGEAA